MDNGIWTHTEQMDTAKYYGFIYLITDLLNSKFYIGKKQYFSVKKLPPLKGHKRKRTKIEEMDWRNYTSSSTYVNEKIGELGMDNFEFEILTECISKADMTYQEVAIMHSMNVLTTMKEDGTPRYYNRAIGNIKFIPPLEVSDKTRKKMREAYLKKSKKTCQVCKRVLNTLMFDRDGHGSSCPREEGKILCYSCKKNMSPDCFSKDRSKKDEVGTLCKECEKTYNREHYSANKVKRAKEMKEYYNKNKDKLKRKARKRYKLKKESK
jgi:hypothetical protein